MTKIALVTPVKDEFTNLPKIISAITAQKISIYLWVIVENDSTDGSNEYLKKINNIRNVTNFKVLYLKFENKEYQLGHKYSTIVKYGFDYIIKSSFYDNIDYIGILDADCFPESGYYKKLIAEFDNNKKLGIVSGIIKNHDGTIEKRSHENAIGACRLWRIKCFKDSPYEVGLSADSISSCKAIVNGWQVYNITNAYVISRKTNVRYKITYPGLSSYYRHMPFHYVIIKSIMHVFKLRFGRAFGLFVGYMQGAILRRPRLKDKELINYNKKILHRKACNFVDR